MKNKKWFCRTLAAFFVLGLAGADIASAYCRGGMCTRDANSGSGNCYSQSGNGTCPNYQGQGSKRVRSRRQCQPGSNCPVAPPNPAPATQPAPTPSN